MSDRWTARLSEYVDGDLAPEERRQLEDHLAACADCRTTVEELRAVVARAAGLEDRTPAADLWSGVARRIGAGDPEVIALDERRLRARRFVLSVPQLAAAAVALMAVSAGTVWFASSHVRGGAATAAPVAAVPGVTAVPPVALATYDAAVRDLQRVLDQGRSRLDTATVRILEHNLQVIDTAIAQCHRALAADPASPYLNAHLAETMKQKLELLRQAARLATART
jgi:anti-sigma factor RsiW